MIGTLTPAQRATLDYHLRETNLITNEELILELTDHYSTALIERTAQGESFDTVLIAIEAEFGGRVGLQKMERQYNRVTFQHYDAQWRQALITQFQQPMLWRQTLPTYLVLLGLSFAFILPEPFGQSAVKWATFYQGFLPGFILGLIPLLVHSLWTYLKVTFRQGIHNIPTEALYLLPRQLAFILLLGSLGIAGTHWVLPILVAPTQAILVSLYLATFGLYLNTAHSMHELLYEYAPDW